jgi:hypothetical protein
MRVIVRIVNKIRETTSRKKVAMNGIIYTEMAFPVCR